jgi:hypothetical protein
LKHWRCTSGILERIHLRSHFQQCGCVPQNANLL